MKRRRVRPSSSASNKPPASRIDVEAIRGDFAAAGLPLELVNELVDSYAEAKRRFYLGDHRPQEVEGGRFSEAVFRILQFRSGLAVTPLGRQLPSVDVLLKQFENVSGQLDAIRIHIPRTLRLIYDIRNRRDAAHLGDGIDPNQQDATLVVSSLDWVMAELVRLYHNVAANDAQRIIEDLVTKEVPAVQEIDGQPVILKDLEARDQAMLMLYRAGAAGLELNDLAQQLRTTRKDNLKARLLRLDRDHLVLHHPKTARFHITNKGMRYVEKKRLAQPA